MEMLYEDPFSPLTGELLPELDGFPILGVETEWDLMLKESVKIEPAKPAVDGVEALPEDDLATSLGSSWLDTKVDLLELLSMNTFENAVPEGESKADEEVVDSIVLATLEQVSQQAVEELAKTGAGPVHEVENEDCLDATSILDMLAEGLEIDNVDMRNADNISVLSNISSEDVESILSSNPPSPSSVHAVASDPNQANVNEDLLDKTSRRRVNRSKPYNKKATMSPEEKLAERKARKMQQNKVAALRYRQKKRSENGQLADELEQLESRNSELKNKVESMTKEINYLKDLMAEVYAAKGKTKLDISQL